MESILFGSSTVDGTAGIGKESSDIDLPSLEDGFRLGVLRSMNCMLCFSLRRLSFSTDERMLGSADFSIAVGVEVQQESAADHRLIFLCSLEEFAASMSS